MVSNVKYILVILLLFIINVNLKDCGNKTSSIRSLHLYDIESLPCMYSGLVDLDKGQDTQIFYWLIHSESPNESTPLVIWLNGGPGSSSLFGLFTEMGPLGIKLNGDNLVSEIKTKKTWTKYANVLFVDQPIGTGFSFSKNLEDIPTNQSEVARQFYIFIQKFFSEHKELLNKNLYINGESYAGKYIPHITKYILDMNEKIKTKTEKSYLSLNLKKILIGNGLFDPSIQTESSRDLVMGANMLSENDDDVHLKYLTSKCEIEIAKKDKMASDTCQSIRSFIENMSGDVFTYDIRKNRDHDKTLIDAMTKYLNLPNVTLSLNIKNGTERKWSMKNSTVINSLKDDSVFGESKTILEELLSVYNFPVILLGGEFDIADGPQGIERMIYSMNYSGIEEFKKQPRTLWKINRDSGGVGVGGYVKQKGKLIFITVRNSGHFFPRDQFGLSQRLLLIMFNETHEVPCVDNDCDLIKFKCDLLGGCNGGFCDISTQGFCNCKDNNYGPDCKIALSKLEENSNAEFLPRELRLYELKIKKTFILEVIFDDKKQHNNSLLISIIPKDSHHLVYNFDKHPIKFNMRNKENYFYVSEEYLDHFIIFQNPDSQHKMKFKINFKDFDFSKSNFWGPGGVGFFFSLLILISGFLLLIVAYLYYKKYKQNKSFQLLSNNVSGTTNEISMKNI